MHPPGMLPVPVFLTTAYKEIGSFCEYELPRPLSGACSAIGKAIRVGPATVKVQVGEVPYGAPGLEAVAYQVCVPVVTANPISAYTPPVELAVTLLDPST